MIGTRRGELSIDRGEFDAAQELPDEALEHCRSLGYGGYMTTLNGQLADLALARGDATAARARVRASLEIARASGEGAPALYALWLATRLAIASGEHRRAVRICAAVASWQADHDLQRGNILWARWSWTPRADAFADALTVEDPEPSTVGADDRAGGLGA